MKEVLVEQEKVRNSTISMFRQGNGGWWVEIICHFNYYQYGRWFPCSDYHSAEALYAELVAGTSLKSQGMYSLGTYTFSNP